MNWSGKLTGGALGLLVGGPAGAVLGFVGGHLLDEKIEEGAAARIARRRRVRAVEDTDADDDATEYADVDDPGAVASEFFRTTFEVMGHVAKADGRVSEAEIQAARRVMSDFRLSPAQIDAAIAYFGDGKDPHYDWSRAMMGLRRACAGRPDLLRVFIEIQMRTAIDGCDLRGAPRALLSRIAAVLGVGRMEFARLEAVLRQRRAETDGAYASSKGRSDSRASSVERMTLVVAYQVLGVPATAGDEEITRAYRRQLSRHHPDKLKSNGLPESMLEHAKSRTQQIIEAWDMIRAARGIKS